MGLRDYFEPVSTMTTAQVREFLGRKNPSEYKMGRRGSDTRSKEVFAVLSKAEKNHLERLAGLLDRKL